jgi:hypothetical protein
VAADCEGQAPRRERAPLASGPDLATLILPLPPGVDLRQIGFVELDEQRDGQRLRMGARKALRSSVPAGHGHASSIAVTHGDSSSVSADDGRAAPV